MRACGIVIHAMRNRVEREREREREKRERRTSEREREERVHARERNHRTASTGPCAPHAVHDIGGLILRSKF